MNTNDELLIELVRDQPAIYNSRDPKYMDLRWKGQIWEDIGRKMKTDVIQCKARWSNIRDNFRKSLAKRRTKSGYAAKKIKPYRFENQLQFLKGFVEVRETQGSIAPCPDTSPRNKNEKDAEMSTRNRSLSPEICSTSVSPSSLIQENPPTAPTDICTPSTSNTAALSKPGRLSSGKRNVNESAALTLMKYLLEEKEAEKSKVAPTVTLDNSVDCFLFGISSTLKLLPPYLQNLAKSEIFSTIQKFELEMIKKSEQRTSQGRAFSTVLPK